MGIKGLSTPVIRDHPKATNTNLRELQQQNPDKNIVGVDMSVLIVKSLHSSSNATSLYHSEPKQPLRDIVNKVTDSIRTFIQYKFKVVCVFDGITHRLKKEGAHHVKRYGNDSALRSELEDLYEKGADDSKSIESRAGIINQVKALRKKLCRNRPDIVHDVKKELELRFKDKIVCVCAPFEADHQLAALLQQMWI